MIESIMHETMEMKFKCVNCNQKTISFFEKWRSGIFSKIVCSNCGAKQYAGSLLFSLIQGVYTLLVVVGLFALFLYPYWWLISLYVLIIIMCEYVKTILVPLRKVNNST